MLRFNVHSVSVCFVLTCKIIQTCYGKDYKVKPHTHTHTNETLTANYTQIKRKLHGNTENSTLLAKISPPKYIYGMPHVNNNVHILAHRYL